ncbi:hypothetical protein OAN307_c03640 [Octadecabacter antarcticus 307]|uniref:Transposase DDE domain-containing protein n=1 Tax=Octadecabacter antarcticus 307 TaxID=391626 RepID=M9R709_9RHOB|nr:transposase [Octadecabacter antarcticus]AGI66116.1 hypothetical protein OAN307_c03640 [Octadecabacter antarcticus 307]
MKHIQGTPRSQTLCRLYQAQTYRRTAKPEVLEQRRESVEHPFGSIKQWMGQRDFLTRRIENVRGEFSLTALTYNIRRALTLWVWLASCEPSTLDRGSACQFWPKTAYQSRKEARLLVVGRPNGKTRRTYNWKL